MMAPVIRIDETDASAVSGAVRPDLLKIIWHGGLLLMCVLFAPLYFSWSAFGVFIVISYTTLLLGHSVGMHRMMIHRTFTCPKPLERVLIYLGVLVGMGGPFTIIKIHDTRDWAQRQTKCHDFFAHNRSFFRDLIWQLFYRFEFTHPPKLNVEAKLAHDPWIVFFQRTWMFHQGFLALLLFIAGGLSFVVWGVCVRVIVCIFSHWTITYFCHNRGPGRWRVVNASVQASNLPFAGFLTHGECWHNNHHAFPESARIGLEVGQFDPAWNVISFLEKVGLASDVGLPRDAQRRGDLHDLSAV